METNKLNNNNQIVFVSAKHFNGADDAYLAWFKCPVCNGAILEYFNYCPHCAVQLDWDKSLEDINTRNL